MIEQKDGLEQRTLRDWRKRLGLTQRKLADLASCSAPWISEAEKGWRHIDTPTGRRVVRALGIDLKQILPAAANPTKETKSRNELRDARRALRKCYGFLSQDSNITRGSQGARDALLKGIGPELKGL